MPRLASPLRTIRVALLTCGELPQRTAAKHGKMLSIYRRWLDKSLPDKSGIRLIMDGYDVTQMRYPRESRLRIYDAVMLTGSPADAWADEPWIRCLISYVQHVGDSHPRIKIYGICFGHHIVTRALGGTVQRNVKGWELGTTTVHTTDLGETLFGVQKLVLQQVHQDHAPLTSLSRSLGSGQVHLLAHTDKTDNQAFVKFYSPNPFTPHLSASPLSPSSLAKQIHIMSIQGHPEFTEALTADIIKEIHHLPDPETQHRHDRNARTKQHVSATRNSEVSVAHDGRSEAKAELKGDDGIEVVGRAFWRMFGVEGNNTRKKLP